MNIELLHILLKYSQNRSQTIREYLDENVQKKIRLYELYDINLNELYLSTRVIIISKSTLDILYEGTIMGIYDDILRINIKSKYCINVPKDSGYIFMKTKKNIAQQAYLKKLLKTLS
tara:strand:- start:3677 stop:4027 length:351 start_codon:yes stop_codon:yes gene_type:complete